MIRRLVLKLFRRRRLDRDLETELAFHREMSAAVGNPIPLGNAGFIREQAFDLWRFNGIENARDSVLVGRAEGQTNEFAQKVGFGVAAERNAYALR